MPPRSDDDAREALVRAAIRRAESLAGPDDAAFLKALQASWLQAYQRTTRRLRVVPSTPAGPRSFHVWDDLRYLRNARELARRTMSRQRVIGGAPVAAHDFPDCVAVGSEEQWGCTGTLVAPGVVVTAGHCADFATRVFFGHDVEKPGRVVRVGKRHRHPRYHQGKHNDLMVLALREEVEGVPPRRIASGALVDRATDGRVVGFGNTDPAGSFGYGRKRQVDVPIASPRCAGTVDGFDDAISYGCDRGLELVAGRPLLERDSCTGDSGGPFYVQDAKERWLLAGATSRSTDSALSTCGDGGIYVRLDKYREWIAGLPGVRLP